MHLKWRGSKVTTIAATASVDRVLESDCRAQVGRPSTWKGCFISVTVRLQVQPSGERQCSAVACRCEGPPFNCPLLNGPARDFDAIVEKWKNKNEKAILITFGAISSWKVPAWC